MNLVEQRAQIQAEITTIESSLTSENWPRFQELIDRLDQIDLQLECERRKLVKASKESNIGQRFEDRTFAGYERKLHPKAYDRALRFAMNFGRENGKGLLFIGTPGTGKTHLAAAITGYLTDKGIAVQFANVVDLLEEVKNNFGVEDIVKKLTEAPLLILDDLGKEKSTEWSRSVLYRIINGRYEDYKPIIVTSNENLQTIENRIGTATMSRIMEMCDGVMMNGDDYRKERLKR